MWYLKGRSVPVTDDDEDSGDDAKNGDGEGRFVPASDEDEDSGDDAKW